MMVKVQVPYDIKHIKSILNNLLNQTGYLKSSARLKTNTAAYIDIFKQIKITRKLWSFLINLIRNQSTWAPEWSLHSSKEKRSWLKKYRSKLKRGKGIHFIQSSKVINYTSRDHQRWFGRMQNILITGRSTKQFM